ncbi:response regulator [Paenibacillus sp. DYY-L-2]|uniref:response regulator n=1 Tax=Paenibacillus sp. DYY-L-2 TaxID=3447013 RepID=UPI003F4F78DC
MRVILVDDERLALDYLERQLLKLAMDIEIIGKYTNPFEGRQETIDRQPDIVFLDIHLPELNGIELAEQILELRPETHVVFVTAYDEYAVKAFELNALDYILKPLRMERLEKTMNRIRENIDSKQVNTVDQEAASSFRINMFRQFSVELEPGQRTLLQWRTTKAQELFLFLLQHRGRLVRKSTLTDLLWSGYEQEKVYSQLYTTIYHIRKTLKPFGKNIQIANTTEGYILKLEQTCLDIEEWENELMSLPPVSANTLDDYLELMKKYAGDYLQEYGYWWSEAESQRYKQLWLDASYAIADWYVNNHILDKATSCYQNMLALHPQEEKAHFELMKIFASQRNQDLVERQYQALTHVLEKELNVRPSGYISEWYQNWAGNFHSDDRIQSVGS